MGVRRNVMLATRKSLEESTAFQKFVNSENHPELATKHIYEHAIPERPTRGTDRYRKEELQAVRPYALIHHDANSPIEERVAPAAAGEGSCNWSCGGTVMIHIIRDTPDDDLQKVAIEFEEIVDDIIDDLKIASQEAEKLNGVRIHTNGPFRTEEREYEIVGDAQEYIIHAQWGIVDV